MTTQTMTRSQELKAKIIAHLRELLDAKEEDITTGIEDGIYEEEENEEYLQNIENTRKLVEEFEQHTPQVYVYVYGGNIQGVSATEAIGFNVFDEDNYRACGHKDQKEFIELFGTPESWSSAIKKRTADGELIPIY